MHVLMFPGIVNQGKQVLGEIPDEEWRQETPNEEQDHGERFSLAWMRITGVPRILRVGLDEECLVAGPIPTGPGWAKPEDMTWFPFLMGSTSVAGHGVKSVLYSNETTILHYCTQVCFGRLCTLSSGILQNINEKKNCRFLY